MTRYLLPSLVVLLLLQLCQLVRGKTDPPDVSALNVVYKSLNSPSQLSGWSSRGGDPCGDDWKGITCSDSSVTEIDFSKKNLNGSFIDMWHVLAGLKDSSIAIKTSETSSLGLKAPSCVSPKSFNNDEFTITFNSRRSTENDFANKFYSRKSTERISLTIYSSADLLTATGSFSPSHLLGEGSIGCVYRAKFADGKVWAVKTIEALNLSGSCAYDFMERVSCISKLHHPNIAELLGIVQSLGTNKNGSLHGFLHLSDEYSKPLTWDTRIRIALQVARAVEYLHEVCFPPVIHKNLKSSSILLDAELNPRFADSGLALFFDDTRKNLGPGYNAPECATSSSYTMQSDVYSFGVVMLELLTGRKPFDISKPRMEQSLVRWATPQLRDIDALAGMVDPALRGLYPPKSLSRFADVIALCIQVETEFRPAMSEVVQSLIRCIQLTSFNRRMSGDLSTSRRSDDSDGHYRGKL